MNARTPPRFHVDLPLAPGLVAALPSAAARHVQVLRLQPGDALTLFDGRGQDWSAEVIGMGRSEVQVRVAEAFDVPRELPRPVTLAVGMPANDRMDWLVEKAVELGAAAVQPLVCERSVLRLHGERAERKRTHWQAVASSAAEQCGRAVVPSVLEVQSLGVWCATQASGTCPRVLLSLQSGATPLADLLSSPGAEKATGLTLLSGPEGGLSPAEEAAARAAGFAAATLGARILRAETAPLAALAVIGALWR